LRQEISQRLIGNKEILYFADWKENKKTVFLSEYSKKGFFVAGTTSFLSGWYFLETLWGGAGTYYEFALLPAVFYYSKFILKTYSRCLLCLFLGALQQIRPGH